MVGTGCEWSASEVALRDDVRKDFVRVRGTKAETRDRDVPLVRVWQRELVDYALEHGMGKDGLLFRPNTSFTLYRACDCVNSTRAIASVMAFCSLGAAARGVVGQNSIRRSRASNAPMCTTHRWQSGS